MCGGWRTVGAWLLLCLAVLWPMAARADTPEIAEFEINRHEDGAVAPTFAIRFELPRNVEDALLKGVPLYFVADAEVFRERWYWRDRRVGDAVRIWRLAYQPLTSSYRVTFGGLSQNYPTRTDALAAISRATRWKIAEGGQVEHDAHHYMEFSFRLDTTLLPRPMQIGVGGQAEWQLSVRRTIRIN